jgi:group I intron endonuclease
LKEAGIYQILNKINGKRYIGSAVDVRRRWRLHCSELHRHIHCNPHLQAAWELYGRKNFAFSVLEYVPDVERLLEREQHYLDLLSPEYNIALVAGSQLGLVRSEEARQRMSRAQRNRTQYSEKTLRALNWKGKVRGPQSEEHRRKLSEVRKGRVVSGATRQKLSAALKGHAVSEETRRKISEGKKSQALSDEHRQNMRQAQKRRRAREANDRATLAGG